MHLASLFTLFGSGIVENGSWLLAAAVRAKITQAHSFNVQNSFKT
jgi:hypothetical protein